MYIDVHLTLINIIRILKGPLLNYSPLLKGKTKGGIRNFEATTRKSHGPTIFVRSMCKRVRASEMTEPSNARVTSYLSIYLPPQWVNVCRPIDVCHSIFEWQLPVECQLDPGGRLLVDRRLPR